MTKTVSEIIEKRDYILDKISFESNDYFSFVGNAELNVTDRLKVKSVSNEGFVVSVGRTVSSEIKNMFNLGVFFDVHFIFDEIYEDVKEDDIDQYIKENYLDFTNICMAKISMLISQITAQLGRGVPIISSPYFTGIEENQ